MVAVVSLVAAGSHPLTLGRGRRRSEGIEAAGWDRSSVEEEEEEEGEEEGVVIPSGLGCSDARPRKASSNNEAISEITLVSSSW